MRYLLLPVVLLFPGCASLPSTPVDTPLPVTEVNRELGRHTLPFQPNERFILESVGPEPGVYEDAPLVLVYFLDGKRREWKMAGPRSTDGYVTELGWFLGSSPEDGNLMQERVIRLPSGEQLVVSGNTIHRGEVRLRSLDPSKHPGFGERSLEDFVVRKQR